MRSVMAITAASDTQAEMATLAGWWAHQDLNLGRGTAHLALDAFDMARTPKAAFP